MIMGKKAHPKKISPVLLSLGVLIASIAFAHSAFAAAYSLQSLPDLVNYHDFVVGPGKIELTISPGQSQTVDLTIANRLGSDKVFSVTEEDFTGSENPDQPVILLGDDRGPYSLKDDVYIPASTVPIPFGQKATMPVTITVPANAQPGALYGSVLVSVVSSPGTTTDASAVSASNPIITRIGTLFFVRVPGPVQAAGALDKFSLAGGNIVWSSSLTKTSPILFDILFKNTGDVYLAPSGQISVTNILGAPIANITVDPWFAMPQSLRFREVEWDPAFLFGRYVAHASVSRGYGTATDTASVVFWVIPWKILLLVFLCLVVIIWLIRWIFSRFSIVSKK
jgi:hypothetical protein